ncbi:hypothetical protein [Flexivirga caeni]|uniref:Uncharacterized protein n=1 Tax=Flexivirga caeni TaxID=2294115 RepID=A0A3M9MED0_9MICO|nr:hypothetical protein [Flexivirga caeni]RNI23932.1 hypothetical protein EFY87_06610 [Flexivirga caeni]
MDDTTLEAVGGEPTLRLTRELTAPIAEVWPAVSQPGVLAEWCMPIAPFTRPTEVGRALGEEQGAPESVDPPTRATWLVDGEEWTFRLAETAAGGCRVELLVTLEDRDEAAVAASLVGRFLDRLAPYLAGEKLTYAAFGDLDADAARLEEYAERFGIDPTPGRESVARRRAAIGTAEAAENDGPQLSPASPAELADFEARLAAYLREHKEALDAAMARRGEDEMMERLEDWLLRGSTTQAEFAERYFFLLDCFRADQSIGREDLDSAWRASHPDD